MFKCRDLGHVERCATAAKRVITNQPLANTFMKGLHPLKQQVLFTFLPAQSHGRSSA